MEIKIQRRALSLAKQHRKKITKGVTDQSRKIYLNDQKKHSTNIENE